MNLLKEVVTEREKNPSKFLSLHKMIDQIESGYLANAKPKYSQKKSFSPSKIVWNEGECARYWYLAFDGAEFLDDRTPFSAANMQNGIYGHERLEKAMLDSGVMLENEVKVFSDDPPIYGFADGILEWEGEKIVAEIKTMRNESFEYRKKSNKAPVYHLEQLIIYMKVLKIAKGVLIYENKNDHSLHIIPVEVSDDYREWVDATFEWMKEVRKAWEDRLLPEKNYRSNSKVCKACPLREACAAADKGDIKIQAREKLMA
jgi:CRISPR/Cas system-associated exonuclease Cas4 (RecB family)